MSTGDLLLRVECYVAVRKALGYACRRKKNCSITLSGSWNSTELLVRFERRQQSSGSVRQHMDLHRPDRPTGYKWCAVSCPISKPSSLRPRCLVRECCHPPCGL